MSHTHSVVTSIAQSGSGALCLGIGGIVDQQLGVTHGDIRADGMKVSPLGCRKELLVSSHIMLCPKAENTVIVGGMLVFVINCKAMR
jgi:hypothetical protein